MCNRQLGLFLALIQFMGYTVLSYYFRSLHHVTTNTTTTAITTTEQQQQTTIKGGRGGGVLLRRSSSSSSNSTIPLEMYLGLSILRAIDLGMTNMAMQYINYPAKTIMKSTRVLFTMIFGIIVSKKRYGMVDFIIVGLMVTGLAIFFHADFHTSAVFHPMGIMMLCISLLCDGAISNFSETLMNQYNVGQDEYIFRLYSIATIFIGLATCVTGDLFAGIHYLTHHGTYHEIEAGLVPTWSIPWKIITLVLLSTSGFLSSSCSALITKSFGALTSSITSTARKAATIFLSFALFPNNKCTLEHLFGIFFFITSLVTKSLRHGKRKNSSSSSSSKDSHRPAMLLGNRKAKGSSIILSDVTLDDNTSEIMMYPNYSNNSSSSPPYLRRKTIGDDFV